MTCVICWNIDKIDEFILTLKMVLGLDYFSPCLAKNFSWNVCEHNFNNNNYFVQDCRAGRAAESERGDGTKTAVWDGETRSQVNMKLLRLWALETLKHFKFRSLLRNPDQVRPSYAMHASGYLTFYSIPFIANKNILNFKRDLSKMHIDTTK